MVPQARNFATKPLHLGGDHLGPQAWKSEPAETAMSKAEDMLAAYVTAGFSKIHLDCSEGCAGEPAQVDDAVAADRAARLAKICEQAAPEPGELSYIVGTEVPPPGGARADEEHGVVPTNPSAAQQTLEAHKLAFARHDVTNAWEQVAGLVVQPGLEFAPDHIDHFPLESENRLSSALSGQDHIAFEAHSTDYQNDAVYPELARRNFAVLKVGPALTFAWREGLFALDHIRSWLLPEKVRLTELVESEMQRETKHWSGHYLGDADQLRLLRAFGYADRIRYYWPSKIVSAATEALIRDIDQATIPTPLISQYFCADTCGRAEKLRAHGVPPARALLQAKVQGALAPYFF